MGKKWPLWWRESDWLLRGSSAANQILLRHSGPILSTVREEVSFSTRLMRYTCDTGSRGNQSVVVDADINRLIYAGIGGRWQTVTDSEFVFTDSSGF